MSRKVGPVSDYRHLVLAQVGALSAVCAADVLFLVEQLETEDPDPSDDCGELDRSLSIYACRLPDCPDWRLVVSIPARNSQAECLVHGLVSSGTAHCMAAYNMAASQLKLQHKPWDPR